MNTISILRLSIFIISGITVYLLIWRGKASGSSLRYKLVATAVIYVASLYFSYSYFSLFKPDKVSFILISGIGFPWLLCIVTNPLLRENVSNLLSKVGEATMQKLSDKLADKLADSLLLIVSGISSGCTVAVMSWLNK